MNSYKNKSFFSCGIALIVALFSINVSSQGNVSEEQLIQIQERVDSIPSYRLVERKADLLLEAQNLENEMDVTQSPARKKSIQERLAEINAELGMVSKLLLVIGGAGALDAIFSDDKDKTAPVITLNGSDPTIVELGDSYTESGATADTGEAVSISGSVNTSAVGTYTITYTATDRAGNTGTASRRVIVEDTTKPVITLAGSSPVTHELGTTYTDAGASAFDLSGAITVTTSGTVEDAVGSYLLTYTATDPSGNTQTATRTVNVVDTTAPTVTVTGDNPATVELGTSYTDPGATATDASGTVTVVTSGTVDTDTVGSYILTYTSTDASGNAASKTRTVNVVDTTAPVITVTGDNPATHEFGTTYTDAGATATDASGTITVETNGEVNADVGTYILTYVASDASGNTATATRTVNVVDTTAPVITVLGTNPATVEYGSDYVDAGATATDLRDGDVTVVSTSISSTTVMGEQTITYTATDAAGNSSTATRTINVVDTTGPVITITGDDPVTVEYGSDYVDAGATATDLRDGTVTVVTTSNSSTTTLGLQYVFYTATDSLGNETQVYRTINVVDTAGPVITILGENPVTVEYGSDYVDAGATAVDVRDGAVTVTTSSTSSSTVLGEQTITYTATDALGNTSTATRIINVVDTTGPVITILGENPVTVEWGDEYIDAGATAVDVRDGTVSVTTSSTSSSLEVGEQTITYTATDSLGNTSTATRIINVVDTIPPVITILGDNPASSELGSNYTDAGATATDNRDGAIDVVVTSTSSENTLGTQYVFYTATDAAGNETQVTRTVNIVDTTDPVFTSGNNFVVAENQTAIGTMTASDLDTLTFSISDVVGGDIPNAIVISSSGALSFVQAPDWEDRSEVYYTATVTVSDSSGNSVSTPITVAVTDVGGFDDNPDTGTDSDTETTIIIEVVTGGEGTGTGTSTTTTSTTTTTTNN